MPEYEVDAACVAAGCPGSSLYVYEGDKFTCCCCALTIVNEAHGDHGDFKCDTEAEMLAHLLEHDAAGHHVRRSLLEQARGREPALTAAWARWAGDEPKE